MRSVVYFNGGTVGDFVISDDRYKAFIDTTPAETQYSDDELHEARQVLNDCLQGDAEATAGAIEEAAACLIWNYFNTHPDHEKRLSGDIMVIDLEGDGATIEYAAVDDIELAQEN
ncbi:hypothetical protein [Magnetospira sp. QH-2]|uniref:hypothetical protein n=1 Tax=Magnetospira sp. (strain QH-2) TaxID=1288970 RepID=UPI0003E80DD5